MCPSIPAEASLVGFGHPVDELLPSQAVPAGRKLGIDASRFSIKHNDCNALQQVRSIALGLPSAGTREPPDGSFDQVCRRLPIVVIPRPHPLRCRQREDAADDRERELEVNVDGKVRMSPKRFQTARPTARWTGLISTANFKPSVSVISEISAFTLRRPPPTVRYTRDGAVQAEPRFPEAGKGRVRKSAGESNLGRLTLRGADMRRASDVLGGGSAVVLNVRSGQLSQVVYQSKTCGVWRWSHN